MAIYYVIEDWAGNLMNYGEFKTADDAFDYLSANFSEEDQQEYWVEGYTR